MLLASREHTFTFTFSQKSPRAPRLLVKSRTALVTAVTTRIVLTLTTGFLGKKGRKHAFSCFWNHKGKVFPARQSERKRKLPDCGPKHSHPVSLEGRGAPLGSRYLMGTGFRRSRLVLGSLGFSLEDSRGPAGSNLGPKTKIPSSMNLRLPSEYG